MASEFNPWNGNKAESEKTAQTKNSQTNLEFAGYLKTSDSNSSTAGNEYLPKMELSNTKDSGGDIVQATDTNKSSQSSDSTTPPKRTRWEAGTRNGPKLTDEARAFWENINKKVDPENRVTLPPPNEGALLDPELTDAIKKGLNLDPKDSMTFDQLRSVEKKIGLAPNSLRPTKDGGLVLIGESFAPTADGIEPSDTPEDRTPGELTGLPALEELYRTYGVDIETGKKSENAGGSESTDGNSNYYVPKPGATSNGDTTKPPDLPISRPVGPPVIGIPVKSPGDTLPPIGGTIPPVGDTVPPVGGTIPPVGDPIPPVLPKPSPKDVIHPGPVVTPPVI